jgi:pyruvate/2-oxoglutarate/acetoin dehydrogenase E1 component
MKAMVEMQFADFVSVGFNQIVNKLAKSYYRRAQAAQVVAKTVEKTSEDAAWSNRLASSAKLV